MMNKTLKLSHEDLTIDDHKLTRVSSLSRMDALFTMQIKQQQRQHQEQAPNIIILNILSDQR